MPTFHKERKIFFTCLRDNYCCCWFQYFRLNRCFVARQIASFQAEKEAGFKMWLCYQQYLWGGSLATALGVGAAGREPNSGP